MEKVNSKLDNIGYKLINNALEKSYNEMLKNEDFKNLVDKIKLDSNILMKYTSTLEESSQEYKNCRNCKNILDCKNKIEGHAYLPKIIDDKLEFHYKPCKFREKLYKETKHLDNIYMLGVNNYIIDASLENVYKKDKKRHETILWLTKFLNSYEKDKHRKGLYLSGSFGCGKTYLVSALFNDLARKNVKSAIVFWPEFLRDLKASFDTDFKEKFEIVKNRPLLLIDDIGAEVVTAWGRDEILCSLLQYRMQEHLPTFFTTNFTKDELVNHLSISSKDVDELKARRIMERIGQLTDDIVMISDNLRK